MDYFRYITTFLIAVSSYLLVQVEVRADYYTYTIDFETDKDGATPIDDTPITAITPEPYAFTYRDLTITFEANYEDDSYGASNLAFEDYGYSATNSSATTESKSGYNFVTSNASGYPDSSIFSGPDSIATGYESQAGDFFMRSGAPMNIIRIANSSNDPVSGASGQIWDIDNDFGGASVEEAYNVYAYSISGSDYTLLAKQLSSAVDAGTKGDSKPWSWSFSGLTAGIDAIVVYQAGKPYTSAAPTSGMTGTGFWNDDYDVGGYTEGGSGTNYMINFDNLSFTVTPEPNSLLAFSGVVSLAFLRRRRRSQSLLGNQESYSAP